MNLTNQNRNFDTLAHGYSIYQKIKTLIFIIMIIGTTIWAIIKIRSGFISVGDVIILKYNGFVFTLIEALYFIILMILLKSSVFYISIRGIFNKYNSIYLKNENYIYYNDKYVCDIKDIKKFDFAEVKWVFDDVKYLIIYTKSGIVTKIPLCFIEYPELISGNLRRYGVPCGLFEI